MLVSRVAGGVFSVVILLDCRGFTPSVLWGTSRCTRPAQAYNAAMKYAPPALFRTLVLIALLPLTTLCAAQTPTQPALAAANTTTTAAATVTPTAPPPGRPDQTIQRIRLEDAGARIDEIRVGGETQSITVQPKTGLNMPAYEVKPADSTRGAAPSTARHDTNGPRVWNVLRF